MHYTNKVFKGFAIVFTTSIIASFIGYLIRVVMTRNLSVADYGLFFAIFTFFNFFAIFKDLGVSQALLKYIPDFFVKKKHDSVKSAIVYSFLIQLLITAALSIIIFSLADFLAIHYFKNNIAAVLIRVFIVLFIIMNLKELLRLLFQAFQRINQYALMYLFENLLIFIFLIVAFYALKSASALSALYSHIGAYFLILMIFTIIFLVKVFSFSSYKSRITKQLASKLTGFGLQVTIANVGGMAILYIDTLILTYFRSLEEVAIYNVAVPTAMMLMLFGKSIVSVLSPLTAELWAKKKKDSLTKTLAQIYRYSLILILPESLLIILFSKQIIAIMFGQQYIGGALALQLLSIGLVFLNLKSFNSAVLSGLGRPDISSKIMLQGAVINIVLNMVAIPVYGINGAAFTSLITYAYVFICSYFRMKKIIKKSSLTISSGFMLKLASASIMLVASGLILPSILELSLVLEIIISAITALLIYAAVILLTKTIVFKEIKELVKSLWR